ncbi:amino acid/amide ABC transporter membrane protein 1, HAAT family [Rhizobiales bacterium GAS191]|nr:amino acid/amide ABC transporter membrane protein 1, HAAT family [Rhizobiales bacterium GAS191]
MTPEIALLLAEDGIANGAIYVLVGLGIVLVFVVTRVIFVPFGDILAYTALTLGALERHRLPGTVWLVLTLAAIASAMELAHYWRSARLADLPRGLALHGGLPLLPAIAVVLLAGRDLPPVVAIPLTLALVLPIGPLLYRIAFRPLADAPVLVLLMVAVALHFAVSGLALFYFGPEGVRTQPLTRAVLRLGDLIVPGQTLIILAGCGVVCLLLFLVFARTAMGKALRATAVNRLGARLCGISPAQTGAWAFLLASALAGITGIIVGPVATLYYDSGFIIGLKAFVGAIIGGLVSYPMAALGALFVGLLESYAAFWSSAFKEVIVFSALIPILIWRSLQSRHQLEDEDDAEEEAAA